MAHRHVTVTLDADTVERVAADLDDGETVAARVRALVEREYGEGAAPEGRGARGDAADGGDGTVDGEGTDAGEAPRPRDAEGCERPEERDGPTVEFVDDCAL